MEPKTTNTQERLKELLASFGERTPKQMRTIRNNLNNRIRSLEDEMKLGKTLPKISASHVLFEFELKECRILLEAAKRQIKIQK